jgi:hypothetical protein
MMSAKVMLDISQQARGFIAGRLNDLTVETRKRPFHQPVPCILITALGRLLQDDVVAFGLQ